MQVPEVYEAARYMLHFPAPRPQEILGLGEIIHVLKSFIPKARPCRLMHSMVHRDTKLMGAVKATPRAPQAEKGRGMDYLRVKRHVLISGIRSH